ncbi:MAG: tRNA (adenosine(37)-N6)-threonylcarbamoyltransferase complex ATPase subunit type 1 TsaE [Magnetovibrionaceae bacterium]
MQPLTIPLTSEALTQNVGHWLGRILKEGDVVLLVGDLGAGKTCLVRGAVRELIGRADEEVPSPTFNLVQVYEDDEGELPLVYHFDLYRMDDQEEAWELGIEDAFADGISFVEWPDRLGELIPDAALGVHIETDAEGNRTCIIEGVEEWLERLRPVHLEAILYAGGFSTQDLETLADDASFRRYFRLKNDNGRAVLMDAPPRKEQTRPFVRMAKHLKALGFSAPEVFGDDQLGGYVLLEDLGDDTYSRLLDAGEAAEPLYALAVDVLKDIAHKPEAAEVPIPDYHADILMREARLLTDWYMPAVLGKPTERTVIEAFEAALRPAFEQVAAGSKALVLRDFHVDNLMRLPRDGLAACGLLDFQDALLGHPAYDLMSLLEDARRDVDDDLTAAMLARYGVQDDPDFMTAYRILGAGRHAKVIGIFTRLMVRDGKDQYIQHIPRCWRLLERAIAEEEALRPLAEWLHTHLPPESRILPKAS